jgi:hypothetical protein
LSEHDEPGPSDLERRLDVAFRETRPRRGFEDELWSRLRARRPWWQRLGGGLQPVHWAGAGAGLAVLVVAGLVLVLVQFGGPHGPSTGASTAASRAAAPAAPAASGAASAGTNAAALPFGLLPAPTAAGVPQLTRPAGPSSLPEGVQGGSVQGADVPQLPPRLAVYEYDPASGPPNGKILDANAVPPGLSVGVYPTRPAADAIAAAEAGRTSSGGTVVLTQARLVYVAVVSGQEGFLEPAYLFTGTAGNAPAQVLVSALAPYALR